MRRLPLLLSAICFPILAHAERGVALPPQLKPAGAPELRDRFHEAIARGLKDADVANAAETRLRLGGSEELMSCAGGPCISNIASRLRAPWLVVSEVQIAGKDYVIRVKLFDAMGRQEAKAEESCDICTVKEAEEASARAAAKLTSFARNVSVAPPPPGQPQKRPETPPPATAPAPSPAPPATTLPSGAEPTPPGAEPTTAPAAKKAGRPFLWSAVALVGVGVVGLAAGIPLLVIDGQPTCDLPNARKSCPNLYDTMGGGAALTAIGLAGLAASGVLFYFDYATRHRKHTVAEGLVPVRGGALVTASGRF